jgi:broad specificity phosphatase PhoE
MRKGGLDMTTTIYLVKHADELKENGIKNINDTTQIMNEKYILSVKGDESPELNNIDVLWSSSYARAKATAKYIADRNNIEINIDSRLNERKLGNLEDLAKWMENKKYGVVQAYLQDKKWKAREGESCEEATKRVTNFFNKILKENHEKRIVLVSHGALISFLLTNWCELTEEAKLIFNNKIIEIKEPSITELTFDNQKLVNIKAIEL